MAILRDDEIRRLLKFLKSKIAKAELALIEDELGGEFGTEFLREPEIIKNFPAEIIEVVFDKIEWQLRIIPYTKMRLIQRGISSQKVEILFTEFLKHCQANNFVISNGAYTIVGKTESHSPVISIVAAKGFQRRIVESVASA